MPVRARRPDGGSGGHGRRPVGALPSEQGERHFDRNRSELGDGLLPETQLELAAARSRRTGLITAVSTFSGSERAWVFDASLPPEGVTVPLDHTSPSLALDVVVSDE
jgi:hypothetical protein